MFFWTESGVPQVRALGTHPKIGRCFFLKTKSRYSDFKEKIWFWSKRPKNAPTVAVFEKKINRSLG